MESGTVRLRGSAIGSHHPTGETVLVLDLPWGINGTLPPDLALIKGLRHLKVGNLRSLHGLSSTLPTEFRYLSSLTVLDLSGNKLSGTIPSDLGFLTGLTRFDLHYNHFSGPIPSSLSSATYMEHFDVSVNELTGFLPCTFAVWAYLQYFDVSDNVQISGTIPSTYYGNWLDIATAHFELTGLSGYMPLCGKLAYNSTFIMADCNVNCSCCTATCCDGGHDEYTGECKPTYFS